MKGQPKDIPMHCPAHSLSLLIKDTSKNVTILNNTICTDGEIRILVKFSPEEKRFWVKDNINIDGDIDEDMVSSE